MVTFIDLNTTNEDRETVNAVKRHLTMFSIYQ